MRPTKGEISVAPASPQATAWQNENSSVMLQRMPSCCRMRAAWMPSQVEASLIRMRSRAMPASSYIAMMRCARATLAAVSKLRRASTSVDTRPGTIFRISKPKRTRTSSTMVSVGWPRCAATVDSSSGA